MIFITCYDKGLPNELQNCIFFSHEGNKGDEDYNDITGFTLWSLYSLFPSCEKNTKYEALS